MSYGVHEETLSNSKQCHGSEVIKHTSLSTLANVLYTILIMEERCVL